MSKRQILMLVGVWVIILAAPGFPSVGRTALMIATGFAIIAFGYRMKAEGPVQQKDLPFTDYKKPAEPATRDDGPVA